MQPNQTSDTLLPRAVRRQMQGVNDRLAARSAAAAAPASPTAPAAASTAVTDSSAAPVQAAPVSSATPAPSAPAPSSTADARENSVDYWRERFRVMQGVNDKLRNDHRDDLAVRDRELAELRTRVAQLEQGSGGTQNSDSPDIKAFFTQEQIDRFGEDQCSAMAATAIKAAREQAQRILEAEVKPIKERAQADDAAKVKQQQDAFWKKLDSLIAEIPEAGNRTIWEINADEAWLEFLTETDADGEIRQARLTRHQRALNAQGVANVVAEYLKKSSPKPKVPPVTPGGGSGNGSDQLPPQGQTVNGKGYPSAEEFTSYSKRAATVRNPRDPRYVTKEERQEMEARLRLPRPGAGR